MAEQPQQGQPYQSMIDPAQNTELRLINQSLSNIQTTIDRNHRENMARLEDHEARLRKIENDRLPAIDGQYENLAARMNTYALVQAGWATLASIIAGFFGVSR